MRAYERLLRMPGAGLACGLLGVAAVTGLVKLIASDVNQTAMAVCYQPLVLAVSGAFGLGSGLVTGLASAAAFNWFFVPPTGTFTVGDERNWVTLAVFGVTAVITSQLAAGARSRRRESESRRRDAELLTSLAQTALEQVGPGTPGPEVERAAARALGVEGVRLALGPASAGAVGHIAPAAAGFTLPLVAGGRPLGLLEVGPALPGQEPRWATPGFAAAVAGLTALAVERGRLLAQALETESLRRSDELKTALLRGVSHEFRTPLTAIGTAAHTLAQGGGDERLAAAIAAETARLERLVANLLDLSRLEAGALETHLDWCAPDEIVGGALEAAESFLDAEAVEVRLAPGLPLVRADPVLCERVLVNLLHNAVRHGAPPLAIEGAVAGGRLELAVLDAGPGVDPAIGPRALEPFVAGGASGGTGVGLALARGLARAQGGSLRLVSGPGGTRPGLSGPGGTRATLALPLAPVPEPAA